MKMQIIRSLCHDPSFNLALEEALMAEGTPTLYLWQNEPTVVIGCNQNPYAECNLEQIRSDGVHLVRRRSGGGAVYHDLGNLNFTLIGPKSPDSMETNFQRVRQVLALCGIEAKESGRNDLEVAGKKISGSAFFEDEQIFCHHGTLLVSADLTRLSSYLTASKLKLASKGVASVRSRVANLTDFVPALTVEAVCSAFYQVFGPADQCLTQEDLADWKEVAALARRYGSFDWVFGSSPSCAADLERKFPWGLVQMRAEVKNGRFAGCSIATDSVLQDGFAAFAAVLSGRSFCRQSVEEALQETICHDALRRDLSSLFDGYFPD